MGVNEEISRTNRLKKAGWNLPDVDEIAGNPLNGSIASSLEAVSGEILGTIDRWGSVFGEVVGKNRSKS